MTREDDDRAERRAAQVVGRSRIAAWLDAGVSGAIARIGASPSVNCRARTSASS